MEKWSKIKLTKKQMNLLEKVVLDYESQVQSLYEHSYVGESLPDTTKVSTLVEDAKDWIRAEYLQKIGFLEIIKDESGFNTPREVKATSKGMAYYNHAKQRIFKIPQQKTLDKKI